MALSNDLISKFVKATKDTTNKKEVNSTVYGTVVEYDSRYYVQLDGSELLTPVTSTADTNPGDRVVVEIKNHTATVTGNVSSPAARGETVKDLNDQISEIGNQITEFEIVIADKVSTKQLEVEQGRIDNLITENTTIKNRLDANEGHIRDLTADNVTINEKLTADEAAIEELQTKKLDAEVADITYATIKDLEATNLDVYNLNATYGDFASLTVDKLTAIDAQIKDLETTKLTTEQLDAIYANIDFANIGEAAIKNFYSKSGIIEDLVISDGNVTGTLVGVTIKGDLIEGGTVVADKLVIKGTDGLYYKLNTNGEKIETSQTDYNSLNGSIITAKSITATKISVDDLVAFDATIGGFHITDDSIYSGAKASADNTTRGIYLDSEGQIAFGDQQNFLKYYKDSTGAWKLDISARSISLSASNKTVEDAIADVENTVSELEEQIEAGTLKGEDAVTLRIDSSRGTVFKNSAVSTVLSAVIYYGSQRITDIDALHQAFGSGAYLEWLWQKMDESTFGTILSTDSRIGNGGFTFTLTPEDVDTKVVFMCQLVT